MRVYASHTPCISCAVLSLGLGWHQDVSSWSCTLLVSWFWFTGDVKVTMEIRSKTWRWTSSSCGLCVSGLLLVWGLSSMCQFTRCFEGRLCHCWRFRSPLSKIYNLLASYSVYIYAYRCPVSRMSIGNFCFFVLHRVQRHRLKTHRQELTSKSKPQIWDNPRSGLTWLALWRKGDIPHVKNLAVPPTWWSYHWRNP